MRPSRLARLAAPAATVATALAIAACGSSSSGGSAARASSDPSTLLKQTFSSNHTVRSGVLDIRFVVTPTGSSVVSSPVSVTFRGPFQSGASGQVPESNFTITASGLGKTATFGVVSTSRAAYVTLQGVTYQLPRRDFKQLQSSLKGSSSTGSAPGLSSLGIDPAGLLTRPTIVGTETIDGATTSHLRAGVDVSALVADVNKLLAKGSKTTSKAGLPTQISASAARKIAAALRSPSVDVWTGKSDSTLRRLTLGATLPVTGTTSTQLGGMTSAAFRLSVDYTDLNRPQTITAPAHAHSYAQLQAKLQAIGSQLQNSLGGSLTGTGSVGRASPPNNPPQNPSGSTGSTGAGSSGQVSRYTKCINGAGGDVKKMQKCASLLNGSSGG